MDNERTTSIIQVSKAIIEWVETTVFLIIFLQS